MDESSWDAVFWDIGGVIVSLESVRRGHEAFVEALCERYLCTVPREMAIERWRDVVSEYFTERDEMAFRPAREGYDRGVRAIVAESVPPAEWRPLFDDVMERMVVANDGAIPTLEALFERRFHVGVVSDVDHREGRRILESFELFDGFDSYTTSEAIGKTKPHPAMFETALEKADVVPERSLMIGDRYENDIRGAKDVGMKTVAYGAENGDDVDYRITHLEEILDIID
ncbi:MAG: HAD family hydrolase [Halanaeroarchaeum sp.]